MHECPTDTEELIYPMRAPSSCSAPPDLVLTSERDQIHTRCSTPQIRETDDKNIFIKNLDKKLQNKEDQERIHLEVK